MHILQSASKTICGFLVTTLSFFIAESSQAASILAITDENVLVRFESTTPNIIDNAVTISGLQTGEEVLAIDFRPATGKLYALGSSNRIYIVDVSSGSALQVGTAGAFTLTGTDFGFDFNPVADRIRVVSDADQNLRLNPNDGSLTNADTGLAYAVGDPNQAANPNIVAAAYSNSFIGAPSTTLFDIDSDLDILTTQNANAGTLTTIGSLGVNATGLSGFDIFTDGTNQVAFASLQVGGFNQLYNINLTTGAATLVGAIGSGTVAIRDIAVAECVAPNISISDASLSEGNSGIQLATFTATLSQACAGSIKVNFGTADGTATVGEDYLPAGGTLVFKSGETSTKPIVVGVRGDTVAETDETFSVILFNADGATISDNEGTGTIVNDDGTPPTAGADLSVDKRSSNEVVVGKRFTYTIKVENQGSQTSNTVVLRDTLPSQVIFRSATTTQGTCTAPEKKRSGTLVCNLGDLAQGATATIRLTVQANGPARTTVRNTATVESATSDPDLDNNSDTARTKVVLPNGRSNRR